MALSLPLCHPRLQSFFARRYTEFASSKLTWTNPLGLPRDQLRCQLGSARLTVGRRWRLCRCCAANVVAIWSTHLHRRLLAASIESIARRVLEAVEAGGETRSATDWARRAHPASPPWMFFTPPSRPDERPLLPYRGAQVRPLPAPSFYHSSAFVPRMRSRPGSSSLNAQIPRARSLKDDGYSVRNNRRSTPPQSGSSLLQRRALAPETLAVRVSNLQLAVLRLESSGLATGNINRIL